jgi:hypothetical protein
MWPPLGGLTSYAEQIVSPLCELSRTFHRIFHTLLAVLNAAVKHKQNSALCGDGYSFSKLLIGKWIISFGSLFKRVKVPLDVNLLIEVN